MINGSTHALGSLNSVPETELSLKTESERNCDLIPALYLFNFFLSIFILHEHPKRTSVKSVFFEEIRTSAIHFTMITYEKFYFESSIKKPIHLSLNDIAQSYLRKDIRVTFEVFQRTEGKF